MNIIPGYRSDHSIITMTLTFNNFDRGRGLWKFNNTLLKDINYISKIKEIICSNKYKYALPIYNFKNIDIIPDVELQFTISDTLFLDTLLMEIRGVTISCSSLIKLQKKINFS